MNELIQWFIETASMSGEATFGMVCALLIVLAMAMLFAYQVLHVIIEWLKRIRPIKINKIQKIEKVVEVPKYTENQFNKEIKEHLAHLRKVIDTMAEDIKNNGVNL